MTEILAKSGVRCDVQNMRYIAQVEGRNDMIIEVQCPQYPSGLVAFVPFGTGAGPPETIDCPTAMNRGIACTLSAALKPIAYRNNTYGFALTIPPGWTVHEHQDDPSFVRADFGGPGALPMRASCVVSSQDTPATQRVSQTALNENVERLGAAAISNDTFAKMDPNAVVNSRRIVRLGDISAPEEDMTLRLSSIMVREKTLTMLSPGRSYAMVCGAPLSIYADSLTDLNTVTYSFRPISH